MSLPNMSHIDEKLDSIREKLASINFVEDEPNISAEDRMRMMLIIKPELFKVAPVGTTKSPMGRNL